MGIFSEVNGSGNLIATLNAADADLPAALTVGLTVDILPGSFGSGELQLRRVVLEYCVPRDGETLTGDEIPRSSCVRENGLITQLEIPSLRFLGSLEQRCYKTDDEKTAEDKAVCNFPGGLTPIRLEVLNDAGTTSPSSNDWKAGLAEKDEAAKARYMRRVVENVDGNRSVTTFLPGPCHHANYIELHIFVGFKEDPDTSYTIRANGTETTMFAQSSSKAKFKLVCGP